MRDVGHLLLFHDAEHLSPRLQAEQAVVGGRAEQAAGRAMAPSRARPALISPPRAPLPPSRRAPPPSLHPLLRRAARRRARAPLPHPPPSTPSSCPAPVAVAVGSSTAAHACLRPRGSSLDGHIRRRHGRASVPAGLGSPAPWTPSPAQQAGEAVGAESGGQNTTGQQRRARRGSSGGRGWRWRRRGSNSCRQNARLAGL
ncbi:hypothetical protein PVAP13_3KG068927 [Panicum virgatum]|uniref:Uncharacterized protein n=1 Tax=Panicum virgatum TaxID=38727 RepID=A0A8T0UR18_PANVG|nr:hypothetical protein PVAP13_3KG068927 [Panicum virgatum]